MKSKSEKYNCKGCHFAELEDNEQSGCSMDRSNLFTDIEDRYYNLERFCSLYRGDEWVEKNSDIDGANLQDLAIMESKPVFGVVIYDEVGKDISDLEKTIDSVLAAANNYTKQLVGVVVSYYKSSRPIGTTTHISNKYTLEDKLAVKNVYIWTDDHVEAEKEIWEKVSKAGYFLRIDCGAEICPTMFNRIDKSLNKDLEKILCFECDGSLAVSKRMARSMYNDFGDYREMEQCLRSTCIERGYYKKL
tara:strand:- start:342 stop:1082 length:741 start_codon:yes stop_codon:yes gene_type:complete